MQPLIVREKMLPFTGQDGKVVDCVRFGDVVLVSESVADKLETETQLRVHRGPVPAAYLPKFDPIPPMLDIEDPSPMLEYKFQPILPRMPLPRRILCGYEIPERKSAFTLLDIAAALSRATHVPFRVNRIQSVEPGTIEVDVRGMPQKRVRAILDAFRRYAPAHLAISTTRTIGP